MIENLIKNAQKSFEVYKSMTQVQVDKIAQAMVTAAMNTHIILAKSAIEETGRGIMEDKAIKNMFSAKHIWDDIKSLKTVGIVNQKDGYIEIAEPMGIVAGITPVTNPTSTTIFKSIICAKSRNPIIFAFHPSAQKCSAQTAQILLDAAIKAGAPKHCIQWIETPSLEATNALMKHGEVAIILATGGGGLVNSAYTSGKPALGVGPGNTPCYVHKDANIKQACEDIVLSKCFDNGMVCASEQAVIVHKQISKKFEETMNELGCYFLNVQETKILTDFVINREKISVNAVCVGKSANWIASAAGIKVPDNTKILIASLPKPSLDYPLSIETLMPVLAYFVVADEKQGFEYANTMLEIGGLGHTAVIHTSSDDLGIQYGMQMPASRVLINTPASQGAIGGIYNNLTPSLTLGCGTYGKNSTTANVSSVDLLNIKRVAKRIK